MPSDPYQGLTGNFPNELLHPLGGLLAHFFRHMTVNVQGEAGGGVAQVLLHRFDVIPVFK